MALKFLSGVDLAKVEVECSRRVASIIGRIYFGCGSNLLRVFLV